MKPGRCYLFAFAIGIASALTALSAEDAAQPSAPQSSPAPATPPPQPQPVPVKSLTAMPLKPAAANPALIDQILAWDKTDNEITVTNGESTAQFVFNLTNISQQEITIFGATGSCGCTDVRTPPVPWKLGPGATGQITANMNVAGKTGIVPKTVTVNADKGVKMLHVKAIIVEAPATPEMQVMNRSKNQQLALTDRQAVFKNDCARCHVEPTKGKMGKELFVTACGICHTAEHRAQMVPDLNALPHETDAIFWRNWITYGKPGSLMPAFAESEGGILSDEQITSLVEYLTATIPSKSAAATAAGGNPYQ